MSDSVGHFYDDLAPYYHLIFEDWDRSIERQAGALDALLKTHFEAGPLRILDCACGIGTQAIGFARRGHLVVGSDLSAASIARARREAEDRRLDISFHVADMTSLDVLADRDFDVVAALDNALPHLDPGQVKAAVRAMGAKVRPGGLFLASTRDYDALIVARPAVQGPSFYGSQDERRIVHQVWDWIDRDRYALHMHIAVRTKRGWDCRHFVSQYRCLLREELSRALEEAGFKDIRWLMPDESGFYQPVVLACRTS